MDREENPRHFLAMEIITIPTSRVIDIFSLGTLSDLLMTKVTST